MKGKAWPALCVGLHNAEVSLLCSLLKNTNPFFNSCSSEPSALARRSLIGVGSLTAAFKGFQPLTLKLCKCRIFIETFFYVTFGTDSVPCKCGPTRLKQHGYPVLDEDLARLSPLIYGHINMLGRYSFALPDEVARGEMRSLRNPDDDL